MDKEVIESVFEKVKQRYHCIDIVLKKEQLEIIDCVLNGKDCMGILGTGFGKSMCYVIPPLILDEVDPEKKHFSLVVSPLRSLMQDQVSQLTDHGVKAAAVMQHSEMSEETIQGIRKAIFSVVFISPEAVNTDFWNGILRETVFRKTVTMVAIDEAHCVIQWGSSFREDCLKLTWLRPVMKAAPFLFLTATCTEKMKDEILRVFSVSSVNVTAAVPNRPNIHLTYRSYPAMNMATELTFYIEELEKKGNMPENASHTLV